MNELRKKIEYAIELAEIHYDRGDADIYDYRDCVDLVEDVRKQAAGLGAWQVSEAAASLEVDSDWRTIITCLSKCLSLCLLCEAPPIMTVDQAAAFLQVSPKTIRALCQDGKLRHKPVGSGRGTIRITREALEDFLKSEPKPEGFDYLA